MRFTAPNPNNSIFHTHTTHLAITDWARKMGHWSITVPMRVKRNAFHPVQVTNQPNVKAIDMKRFSLLLLIAVLTAGMVTAQPRHRTVIVHHGQSGRYALFDDHRPSYSAWHRTNTYFGVRLGLNAASVRSEANALDGSSLKAGLNVGIVGGVQLSHRTPVFFESGLFYSQKGGKSNNVITAGGGKTKFTYGLNYLEVPILIKYKHIADWRNRVTIEPFAGAFVGVGVGGNIKDYGDRVAFDSYDNGFFKRGDAGIKLGCGVGFGMGYFDVSYDIGLANVGQDAFDDTHTGCLTVNIGVNF